MLKWLKGPNDLDNRAEKLYGAVVAAARRKEFYRELGVPDTPEGRFELVALHLFLALDPITERGTAGKTLSQRAIEVFITDMDDCMREMGVGDMAVAKRVKRAAATFYERSGHYREALAADDDGNLIATITQAIPDSTEKRDAARIARYMRKAYAQSMSSAAAALSGNLNFPEVA